jgi:hypothetical protein
MPVQFSDSIFLGTGRPVDYKYTTLTGDGFSIPWSTTASACSGITASNRHIGLTVLVGSTSSAPFLQEYWWQNGISNKDLVLKQVLGGVVQKLGTSSFPILGDPNILYVDQSSNLTYYWSASYSNYQRVVETFKTDLRVYLGPSYSFGKYINGQTISAAGKTPAEIILDAISQPLPPTVGITIEPTSVPYNYNTSTITATISVSYTINSNGALVSSGIVSYATNSNPYSNPISKVGGNSYTNTYTQSITYPGLMQTIYNYKYSVVDTGGGSNFFTTQISMLDYVAPTIPLTQNRANPQAYGETNTLREMGNVGTFLNSTAIINPNTQIVPLKYYRLSYSYDGASYSNYLGTVSISYGSGVPLTSITASTLSKTQSNIYFRVGVTDMKTTNYSTPIQVSFYYPFFYGMTPVYDRFGITSSAGLNSLTKLIITKPLWISSQNQTVNLNGTNAHMYFMYPSSYGQLTSIKDSNNLDNTGNFTYSIVNINSPLNYWSNASYYIYVYYANGTYSTTINNKAWQFQF